MALVGENVTPSLMESPSLDHMEANDLMGGFAAPLSFMKPCLAWLLNPIFHFSHLKLTSLLIFTFTYHLFHISI